MTNSEPTEPNLRALWITIGAEEILELKRIKMDRDGDGAVDFFFGKLIPRIITASKELGIAEDLIKVLEKDDHLLG